MIFNFICIDIYFLSLPIQTNVQIVRSGIVNVTVRRLEVKLLSPLIGGTQDVQ